MFGWNEGCCAACWSAVGLSSQPASGLVLPPLTRLPQTTATHPDQGLSVLATRGNGKEGKGAVLEYNSHNLYGLTMARATYEAVLAIKRLRPFVLSR